MAASVRSLDLSTDLSLSLSPTPPTQKKKGPGTRPGPGGAPLISTGVAGIDSALGGGLPLGRLLLVESGASGGGSAAGPATVVDALARLFVAEGAACGQRVAWVQSRNSSSGGGGCEDAADLERQRWWLPGRAVPRAERAARAGCSVSAPPSTDSAADADAAAAAAAAPAAAAGDEEEEDEGSDLKIAWQYRRYIASARAAREEEARGRDEAARAERRRRREEGSGRTGGNAAPSSGSHSSPSPPPAAAVKAWCHDFDLTRRTLCPGFGEEGGGEEASPSSPPPPPPPPPKRRLTLLVAAGSLAEAADAAVAAARASTADPSLPPARILVQDPGSPEWWTPPAAAAAGAGAAAAGGGDSSSASVPLLLRRLRGALRGARAAAVVTVRAGALSAAELAAARACADAVISFSPLQAPAAASQGFDAATLALAPSLVAGAGRNGSAVALARVVRLPPPGPAVPSRPQPCSNLRPAVESAAPGSSGAVLVVSRRRGTLGVAPAAIDHDAEEAAENAARGVGGAHKKSASAACGARPGSRSAAALEF